VRCRIWGAALEDAPWRLGVSDETEETTTNSEGLISQHPEIWQLVQAIVKATDELAESALSTTLLWQMGYAISAAVYELEAGVPFTLGTAFPKPYRHQLWQLMQAAQTMLTLILLQVGDATPVDSLD
jgi:hypothetical protein